MPSWHHIERTTAISSITPPTCGNQSDTAMPDFPWRVKVRPPCFNIYQAFPQMIKGGRLADAVAIIGGLNIIAGELDR